MTNNPTIDGVSLLPCPFCGCEVHKITGFDYYRIYGEHAKGCVFLDDDPIIADAAEWNKRAPAVERQDASVNWKAVATEQMGIIDQRQSTIARLEARVAELESGRGEPMAYLCVAEGARWLQYHSDLHKPWNPEDVSVTPLFTAPPAPVSIQTVSKGPMLKWNGVAWSRVLPSAVVLPERDAFEQLIIKRDGGIRVSVIGDARSYNEPIERDYDIWRACLDATAALNGPAK